jgi:hypothetical protein
VAGGGDTVVGRWRSGGGWCGGRMQRGACGMARCGTAAALAGVKYAGFGGTAGSRFKGSVRDGLNGTVEPGFVVGSRFNGSVRDGLDGAVGPRVGAPCGGRLAEGAGRKGAGSVRAVQVGAACGIAGSWQCV